jgi:glyoxylase-like metal-dependent hydrolase (beta-lactamase superfamily II)
MKRTLALLAALGAASPLAAQDRDFSKVEIKVEKVGGSVSMLTGAGGNIAVSVGEDGVVVVDDQFAPLVPKIEAAIKSITPKPVRFLLNTHWHGDHTGGNAAFSKTTTIIAHDNVRKRLAEGMPDLGGRKVDPAAPEALPVITFDSSLTVHLNGEDVRALHYARGHTDGDVIVFFPKSNVVHMGDDFVTYGFPFVDVASGGSVVGMADNVEKAIAQLPEDVKVIPGHGALSTKADVRKFTEMLRDCIKLVSDGKKAGKSIEQMQKENVLAKYDSLGQGFIKTPAFIEQIAKELDGQKAIPASTVHH